MHADRTTKPFLKSSFSFDSSLVSKQLSAIVRRHGWIVPIYLMIALIFTYPTVLHLGDAIGGEQDALENYWNLWWTYRAIFDWHQSPFQATIMFHPFGLPLYFHTYNPLNAFLSLPLQAIANTAVAYNLLNLFAFVMAGIGAYSLVFYLTKQRPASFVAGLIYAFSPYMEFHLRVGQPFMLSLEWLPFYLLFLLRGLRERWIFLPVAGFFLVLIGMTDWHYTSYALVITAITGLYEIVRVLAARRKTLSPTINSQFPTRQLALTIAKLALVGMVFAIGISPVLVPMLIELGRQPYAVRPIYHSIIHSTDLLAFFLPSIYHPLWGRWASGIFYTLVPNFITGGMATLGYVALVLAIIGVWRERRRSLLFLIMFVAFFLLALGPFLQVNGVNSYDTDRPIPMPYLLFNQLPFMNIQRIPSRFVSVVMLSLATLAGLGVASLWNSSLIKRLSQRGQLGVSFLIAGLVLFEYWPTPIPITPIGPDQVSGFYRQLAADHEDYVIFEVPYKGVPSMFYQTIHGKRTIGGRIAREVSHPWNRARFFGDLIRSEEPTTEIGVDNSPEAAREALACQGVRYVIFYKQKLEPQQAKGVAALEPMLFSGIKPVYEDDILRAYGPLQTTSNAPFWTPSRSDWYNAEADSNGTVSRWLKAEQGGLMIYPCLSQTTSSTAMLSFDAYGYGQDRTVEVSIGGAVVGYLNLPKGTLRNFKAVVPLQPDENRVNLRPIETATIATDSADPRPLTINISRVSVESLNP